MARRTNKTDHVLSLLSAGNKKQENGAEQGEKAEPPVNLKKDQEDQEKTSGTGDTEMSQEEPSKEEEPKESSVSVVHMSADEENPIAESVKSSLEEELDAYLGETAEPESEDSLPDTFADETEIQPQEEAQAEPEPETLQQVTEPETLQQEPEPEVPAEAPVAEEPSVTAEPKVNSSQEPEPEQPMEQPEPTEAAAVEPNQVEESSEAEQKPQEPTVQEIEPKVAQTEKQEESVEEEKTAQETAEETAESVRMRQMSSEEIEDEESSYGMLNVMERIVRDKVEEYIQQFDACTCRRCREDTIALSLTHLPAKYVVANKNALTPLLSFYEKRYAGQVTVEVTKACMRIKEHPHH